ncbi:MAG TPA: hypothetical protein DCO78_14130 [Chitinophagaceae bacterium]|nr:hypothetical protein [Chitinophagaceae bacterium]
MGRFFGNSAIAFSVWNIADFVLYQNADFVAFEVLLLCVSTTTPRQAEVLESYFFFYVTPIQLASVF